MKTNKEVLIPRKAFLIEHKDMTSSLKHWLAKADRNISPKVLY